MGADGASVESGDNDSGDDFDDMDDGGGGKKRKRPNASPLDQKVYNELREELIGRIKPYLDGEGLWKEAKGERNRVPPGVKDSILDPFSAPRRCGKWETSPPRSNMRIVL